MSNQLMTIAYHVRKKDEMWTSFFYLTVIKDIRKNTEHVSYAHESSCRSVHVHFILANGLPVASRKV
jgi:hypothetical protein